MERRVTSKVFFLGGEGREMAVGVEEVGSCSPAELSRWKNESLMFRFYLQLGELTAHLSTLHTLLQTHSLLFYEQVSFTKYCN